MQVGDPQTPRSIGKQIPWAEIGMLERQIVRIHRMEDGLHLGANALHEPAGQAHAFQTREPALRVQTIPSKHTFDVIGGLNPNGTKHEQSFSGESSQGCRT